MASNCCCCICIPEKEFGILQRFGKFVGVAPPGASYFCWPCTSLSGTVSTKLRQIVIRNEAKTKENVFVTLTIAIQYMVEENQVKRAYYSMENPSLQMQSFVEDAIRSIVPTLELEHLFVAKDKISKEIMEDLAKKMTNYGYTIVDTLITDIDPEQRVKAAMNRITQARRLREAAEYEAETSKVVRVKQSEAEAVSKQLQGEGVAAQRKAILHGLQEGVADLTSAIGVSPMETMKYVMLTQYFDMLRDVGSSPNKNTVFVATAPGNLSSMADQVSYGMMEANQVQALNNNEHLI